jgi:hypothetical protein
MKRLTTTNGFTVFVDDEDYEKVIQHKWRAHKSFNTWYAEPTSASTGRAIGCWSMHRFVLNPPRGVKVDHVNGNGLDNRRENLRLCNDSQNQANRIHLTKNTSGYRGVTWNKKSKKWQAGIKATKSIHLGLFNSPEDAARAYDAKAIELFGEFARTNFTKQQEAA